MSIRITASASYRTSIVIRAIDDTVRYAQGAHTTDGAYWFSSPMGPIEGYPARVPSANRVHTVPSVTRQANTLRAFSSPTLRYDDDIGLTVEDYRIDVIRLLFSRLYSFPRGQSIGIAAEDSHCLNTVRNNVRDAILADSFVRAYLSTALWSSTMMPEDSERSDCSYHSHGCDVDDVSLETVIGAKRDCDAFQLANENDLELADDNTDRDAHNFWLSRNGHGAGFFDRCDDVGTRLQDASRVFGEVNLYHVGNDDDMIIYSDADVDTLGSFDLSAVWD